MKRILSIALAICMLFTSLSFAKGSKEELMEYEMRFATVKEVIESSYRQILVENEIANNARIEKEIMLFPKTSIVDLKTGEFVKDYKFKEGERIQYFYRLDTPITLSLPAQMTPDVIGVNVDQAEFSLDVDYFDKKGQGKARRLDLNLPEDGKVKNFAGKEIEDFLPNELLVLYTIATRSLPPIATPEKIEILKRGNIYDDTDKADEKDILKAYEKTPDFYYMRKALEGLGAEVNWIRDTNTTEITKADKKVIIYNDRKKMQIDDMLIEMTDFKIEDKTSFIGREDLIKILEHLEIKY